MALNLARGKVQDIEDAKWLAAYRGLTSDDIVAAIATLPVPEKRDAALRHLARM